MCGSLKSRKKSLKTLILGTQGRSRSSILVPPESSSAVLVMLRSKSVSICNRSLDRLDDSSRNRAFWRGYPNLMHSYGGLLQPRGRTLHRWNLRLMPNISCADYHGMSRMVSAQFTLKLCVAEWNREKFTKTHYFGLQGRLRSSMLVPPERPSAVLDEPIVVK